ncbi:hypothetical protein [Rhodococcus sp. NBC_00294]|uniref:hypothetical protein n=1 Tax=Rhodococcus sp. NBC_00294 TaxID=2976004 RepID=UPI002E2E2DE6|nr:hypothetical protein [Rhodococcus sp. NBC_00294]
MKNQQKTESASASIHFRTYWWMNPIWVIAVLLPLIVIYAYRSNPRQYAVWRVQKFVSFDTASVMLLGLLAMAIGYAIAGLVRVPAPPRDIVMSRALLETLKRISTVSLVLLLLSYAVWGFLAVRGGLSTADIQAVLGFERGAVSGVKDRAAPVGGLTSFTQLGPAIVVLEIVLLRASMRDNRRVVVIVVALASVRALFYGERLALIEVLLPLAFICLALPHRATSSWRSSLGKWAPAAALPALWTIFAVFEYGRSWAAYKRSFDGSYAEFVTQRLSGYYATSINNSALFYDLYPTVNTQPLYSFASFWDAPILSSILGTPEIGSVGVRTWWRWTLASQANPEFNNPGSFAVTGAELGLAQMALYWFVAGAAIALIYRSFRRASVFGLVALPVCYVGLIELPRIIYWMQGRFTATMLILLVLAYVVRRDRSQLVAHKQAPRIQLSKQGALTE